MHLDEYRVRVCFRCIWGTITAAGSLYAAVSGPPYKGGTGLEPGVRELWFGDDWLLLLTEFELKSSPCLPRVLFTKQNADRNQVVTDV